MSPTAHPAQHLWLLALAVIPLFGSTAALPEPLPPHPRLLLDAQDVARLKQRIASAAWAKASWAQLKGDAERLLGKEVELPPRGGNWSHNYVCPTHGARLSQGRQLSPWQWEHTCPVGRHVLHGDPSTGKLDFDGNAIAGVHGRLAHQIVEHGLVFQVTGEGRHAAKARGILLAYANRYLQYPLHNNQGRPGPGGRVASQSLSEAGWLTTFTQGADLVWTTLSDADRVAIADKVLRPALSESILTRKLGVHNIQCHHNSAIGAVGFLLGDEALIRTAIDEPRNGFRTQLEKGVLADGMWTEGASGYHFYTIQGLWPLAEAARHCGLDLHGPRLRSLFDGPLALAMPDFVLPNFNDSGTVPLRSQADLYELAFARYTNAAYVPLLAGSDRRGRLALLYGTVDLPSADQLPALASRNSPGSGYAILQQGQGRNATWLCLKYGPHGGGHGHPDKNTFILYSRGEILAPDAGTHAYGSPLHGTWDKTTLAHNTLVVDETSQEPATGRCLAFGSERGVDYAVTDAGPAYAGVCFTRAAALLNSNLVVFVDQVQAERPRTLDLAYHQIGTWADVPAGKPWSPPTLAGYSHFADVTAFESLAAGMSFTTRAAADWLPRITFAGGEAGQLLAGCGILKTTEDRVPMLVQRRMARSTAFVWALSLDGAPVALNVAPVKAADGQAVATGKAVFVQVESSGKRWWLLVNPAFQNIVAPEPRGAQWRTSAAFSVKD